MMWKAYTNGLQSSGSDLIGQIELDYLLSATWDNANTSNYTLATPLGNTQLAAQPKYIIKHLGTENLCLSFNGGLWDPDNPADTNRCKKEIFRITAHGTGLTANTTKILQAYYERPKL